MPLHVEGISGEHVREFMADLLSRQKASTAHARYRGLQAFFAWLVVEGEIKDTPLKNLKPPRLPQEQPPVLTEDQLRALLHACEKDNTFTGRRDAALIRLMADTGARLSEVVNLRWQPDNPRENDIDFSQGLMRIRHGKGDKERIAHLGNKTLRGLDRYLRKRAVHKSAGLPWLWLAPKGRLSPSGVQQLLKRRGAQAGIEGLYPHMLRHSAAHHQLLAGAQETDLMRQMGWSSRAMVARYGASAGQERSWASHAKFGLGDRL
jgi:site-specific recombinase XerD